QNYPNPFNPSTIIEYYLSKPCHVTLNIYNVLGQKVRTLKNEYQGIGKGAVSWEGKDDRGKDMPSGTYFYKLKAGDLTESRKMLLIK
ncbi:MAG TPA: T9SS type A sorting domain-containing protein, partial [candidate division Zixibacteria bacterium]